MTKIKHPANRHEFFPANVVEVKTTGIGFPAIDAWMPFQVIPYPFALFSYDLFPSFASFTNIL